MNIEKMLAEELHIVADDLDVPRPPIDGLVREGTKTRNRRRTYVAGVAAAAVAVIVTGLAIADGDPRASDDGGPSTEIPSPSVTEGPNGLPVGKLPTIPWVDGEGILHVGADTYEGTYSETAGQLPGLVALKAGNGFTWVYFDNGEPIDLVRIAGGPIVSPNGRWIAVIRRVSDAEGWDLVLIDARNPGPAGERSHLLGHVAIQGEDEGATGIAGVDDHGRIYYGNMFASFMWLPDIDEVVELRQNDQPPYLLNVGPDGPVMAPGPGQDAFLTVMNDDTSIQSQVALPNVTDEQLSPDGTRVAWLTDEQGKDVQGEVDWPGEPLYAVTMQVLSTGTRQTVALPKGSGDIRRIQWESNDSLLLTVFVDEYGEQVRFARCRFDLGSCEWALVNAPSQS